MNAEKALEKKWTLGHCYRLLAECYYPPTAGVFDTVHELEQNLFRLSPEAELTLCELGRSFQNESDLESLQVDFAKLFVGPFHLLAAPYGSVYLEKERRVMGESTMDALRRYRDAGLDLSSEFLDAPDHVAVELELMYFLIFKELETLSSSNIKSASEFLDKQQDFFRDHLGAWGFEFADQVEQNASTAFYRNLAKATRILLSLSADSYGALSIGDPESIIAVSCLRQTPASPLQ
jgi:TorA maturation chaperone TorD